MWRNNSIPLLLICVFAALVIHRIWRTTEIDAAMQMMAGVELSDEEERELYMTPAGRYTEEDIEANGPLLPSQRYRGFRAQHDFNPPPGAVLCPISRTKAHPDCTWIIGGETYAFCCPPCIDELVRLAKEEPEQLLPPSAFVND